MNPSAPSVQVAYIVQSVPARRELRGRLLDQLPLAVVIEDEGPRPPSPWRGYRLCLDAIPANVTHALIIQDDTVVCANFTLAVDQIAQANLDVPVCLFVSATRTKTLNHYRQAVRASQRYSTIWFQDFCPVVATLWPRIKVQEFLEWCDADPKLPMAKPYRSDDAVVGSWMKFTRQTVRATIPSLVEHPDDTESVKWNESRVPSGTRNKYRRAFHYIGTSDPLELNWDV